MRRSAPSTVTRSVGAAAQAGTVEPFQQLQRARLEIVLDVRIGIRSLPQVRGKVQNIRLAAYGEWGVLLSQPAAHEHVVWRRDRAGSSRTRQCSPAADSAGRADS